MSSEAEFLSAYARIKQSNSQVLALIDDAIRHEEQERPQEAIRAYEQCVQLIDDIFTISVGLPENIDAVTAEWSDACDIIQKLKGAKVEMSYRLKVLHARHSPIDVEAVEAMEVTTESTTACDGPVVKKRSVLLENPATHDAGTAAAEGAVGGLNGNAVQRYRQILTDLRHVIGTADSGILFDTLFESQVKLYKIQPDGVVSTMGETSMTLVMCTASETNKHKHLNGVCFIQCAMPNKTNDTQTDSNAPEAAAKVTSNMIWIYALVPTITTCYRTNYGAFILPDMEADAPGHVFGLMLIESRASSPTAAGAQEELAPKPEGELTDLEQFFLDLLEAVLLSTVDLLEQPAGQRVPRAVSEQVSLSIVNAADFIARNLVRGAEKTGELMVKSTPYIISKMNPAPADAPPVSSKVQTSVEVAKNVTSVAAGATGWLAGKVGSASMALGRFLAPHIQSTGATLLEKGFGYDSTEAESKMEGAMTIAAGAVEGFSTVYNGLETSAKILGNNLSTNSVKIIEYKYGHSAGNVAAGTFDTIGNAFNVSQNVNYITPKGIAKKMAKNTGKAVVDDYKRNLRMQTNCVPAGALYPDLRGLKEK